MGNVYIVEDEIEEEIVALKSLHSQKSNRKESFEQEFKTLADLEHPNLESVFDYGVVHEGPDEVKDNFFFTCEYIDGESWSKFFQDKPLDTLWDHLVGICRALQFIHSKNLVHYDVKPENILVCNSSTNKSEQENRTEQAKLVDFGLAGKKEISGGLDIRGTVPYIAPELIRGDPVDGRADLYSLGVTIYQVVSGKLPFKHKSTTEVLKHHLETPPPRLENVAENIPDRLQDLVLQLLSKQPDDRPSSANNIIRKINQITGNQYRTETRETLRSYVSSPKFVGREQELTSLKDRWHSIYNREEVPTISLISGESGIGKSRLQKEFTVWAQTNSIPLIHENASEGIKTSFGLMEKVLEKLIRNVEVWEQADEFPTGTVSKYAPYLKQIVPELRKRYNPSDPPEVEDESRMNRLLDMSSDFVINSIPKDGLILVLDNLQWADEMSLRLLKYIGRKNHINGQNNPLFIIGSRRLTGSSNLLESSIRSLKEKNILEEQELDPFSEQDVETFVTSMFGNAGDKIAREILKRDQSGNPLFAEEFIRACVDEDVLVRDRENWHVEAQQWENLELPEHVGTLIDRRLKSLDSTSWKWLVSLAAWGGEIHHSVMEDIFEPEHIPGANELIRLEKRGFIRITTEDQRKIYRFAHDRFPERIRKLVTDDIWKEEHRLLLKNLEEHARGQNWNWDKYIEKLAILAREAGETEKFKFFGEEAALNALDRHAHERANNLYSRLLETDLPEQKRTSVMEEKANLSSRIGEVESALETYRNLLEQSELTEHREIRIRRKIANLLEERGEAEEAVEEFSKALSLGEGANNENQENLLEQIKTLIRFGRYTEQRENGIQEAIDLFQKALSLSKQLNDEEERLKKELDIRSEILMLQSRDRDPSEIIDELKSIREKFHSMGEQELEGRILIDIGYIFDHQGEPEKAVEFQEQAEKIYRELNDRKTIARIKGNMGSSLRKIGRSGEALKIYKQALQIYQKFGDQIGLARLYTNMANIFLGRKGNPEKALEYFHKSLELTKKIGRIRGQIVTLNNIGNVYRSTGKLEEAYKYYQKSKEIGENSNHIKTLGVVLFNIADIQRHRGNLEKATSTLEELEELAEKTNSRLLFAHRDLIKGRLQFHRGNLEEAQIIFEELKDRVAEAGLKPFLMYAREWLNRSIAWNGEPERAYRRESPIFENPDDYQDTKEYLLYHNLLGAELVLGLYPPEKLQSREVKRNVEMHLSEIRNSDRDTIKFQNKLELQFFEALHKYVYKNPREGEREINSVLKKASESSYHQLRNRMEYLFERRKSSLKSGDETEDTSIRPVTPGKINLTNLTEEKVSELLNALSEFTAERNPDRLLNKIIDSAIQLTGARRGFLAVLDDPDELPSGVDTQENILLEKLNIKVARNQQNTAIEQPEEEMSRNVMMKTIRNARSIRTVDVRKEEELNLARSIQELQLKSIIASPLLVESKPVGALYLDHPEKAGVFDEEALNVLELLSGHAAVALENARLHEVAIKDRLTGLATHGYFEERVKEEISKATRFDGAVSLLFIDLDGLKLVNDRMGHMAGDELIEKTGKFLRQTIRGYDVAARTNPMVGRYGGDEFEILLPGTDKDEAQKIAERMIESLENVTFEIGDRDMKPRLSIGIASSPEDGTENTDLIEKADRAMQEAKKREGNWYEIFSEEKSSDSTLGSETSIIGPHEQTEYLSRNNRVIMDTLRRVINSNLSLEETLNIVINSVAEATHAQRGFILLQRDESLSVEAVYLSPESGENPESLSESQQLLEDDLSQHLSTSLINKVLDSGNGILAEDAVGDSELTQHHTVEKLQLQSLLVVPLLYKDNPFGVVYLDNPTVKGRFDEEDLGLASSVASEISQPVHEHLHRDQKARKSV